MSSRSRITKNDAKWHRVTIIGAMGDKLVLMGKGRGVQLSIWCNERYSTKGFAWFTGEKTLRRLAREILRRPPKTRR